MSNGIKVKTCGRDRTCDLVLDQPTVSRFHAQIELGEDGLVCIQDTDSKNGTFLNRNDCWIRVLRVTMCIGDRIRFGDCEVPLENLTAVFGNRSGARLGAKSFPLLSGKTGARLFADLSDRGSLLSRPRRNPATGKIEDDHAG